jgi:hypothetical protein
MGFPLTTGFSPVHIADSGLAGFHVFTGLQAGVN